MIDLNWKIYLLIILMTLSVIDLGLTFYYINTYKNWQNSKPYNMIEMNPLLVFLWNNFGLKLGMFIGSVIILSLVYIVGKTAHPLVSFLLLAVLTWTMFNHTKNIGLLTKLIELYPSGSLPEKVFGKVIGSN